MTMDDVKAVVAIHRQSFPGSRSTNLGDAFLRKMYRWYLTFYPELAWVACIDAQVMGFVTGATGGSARRRFRYALPEIVWGFLTHPRILLQPDMFELWQSYLMGLLPEYRNAKTLPPSADQLLGTQPKIEMRVKLDSIAVHQNARGRNVGKSLVLAFELAAKKRGATKLGLGVEADNIAARHLYEVCGWHLDLEDIMHNSAIYSKVIE